MLGFTRDSILKLSLDAKIEKSYPLIHLKRWAPGPDSLTLDFGTHESEYLIVTTLEGEKISQIIAGYIDILLKKQRDNSSLVEDDTAEIADIGTVQKLGSRVAITTTAVSLPSNYYGSNARPALANQVHDVESAQMNLVKMANALLVEMVAVEVR